MSSKSSSPDSIPSLTDRIANAARDRSVEGGFISESARRCLIQAAEELVLAARSPEENIFAIAQQPAQNAALRCAIALGIPSALPQDGSSANLQDLAECVGADEKLLGRILRACACTSLVKETSELHYSHNAISRSLLSPANRALLTLMFDYNGRAIFALPEFLEQRQWKDPGSYQDSAFMAGSRAKMPMWEYRDTDDTCRNVFDLGMQSGIVAALSTGKSSGPFPFSEELRSRTTVNAERVTIVDIGGGRGQALQSIRDDHPDLAGRFVLLDLAPVIESAIAAGLPAWLEPVIGSFFDPLPIHGAHIYYLRRVMHNWNDDSCRKILSNIAKAMDRSLSRLLITDMVVHDTAAVREMAWEDLNMMTIGGVERTEREWRSLLGECGFQVEKIWRNAPIEHAVIDARLR